MFFDEAIIYVVGGKGGNGCASFHSDKFRRDKVPDGGNGGRGGMIHIEAQSGRNTLNSFRKKNRYHAGKGGSGGSNNKTGAYGEDICIGVPPGTVIRDEDGNVLCDLAEQGQKFPAARGGSGGKGNTSMSKGSRRRVGFAEKGEPGEEIKLFLELKLVADVAIVGFPNAGKSSLIACVSGARPKIADYPFTTTEPNLGMVEGRDIDYVVTDVPGLIKGAHSGKGMGTEFLRHIERASIIIYLIDMSPLSGVEPRMQLIDLEEELGLYNSSLLERTRIVAANKIDLSPPDRELDELRGECDARGLSFFTVSVITRAGISGLLDYLEMEVEKARSRGEKKGVEVVYTASPSEDMISVDKEDGCFVVKGKRIERMVSMTDWNNDEALANLSTRLKREGMDEVLVAAGAESGDEVVISGHAFEFVPDEEPSSSEREPQE
ncbi:MAG: GTPase ObgE [Actinobacteria bacterium]|nr:GTPase ObgE [Actinomycetota bacterium]